MIPRAVLRSGHHGSNYVITYIWECFFLIVSLALLILIISNIVKYTNRRNKKNFQTTFFYILSFLIISLRMVEYDIVLA